MRMMLYFALVFFWSVSAVAQGSPTKALQALDNCAEITGETVDVLRHGYAIAHRDEILAKKAQNRASLQALTSGLVGVLGDAGVLDDRFLRLGTRGGVGYWDADLSPGREEYRKKLRETFRNEVKGGLRSLKCTEWAEDQAWAYAPAWGNECAGLPNEPVDTLRNSAEYFGRDRWNVRQQILRRYRNAVRFRDWTGTCIEYAQEMASRARVLDP